MNLSVQFVLVLVLSLVAQSVSTKTNRDGVEGKKKIDPLSDRYIARINKQQSLWRAGRNFPKRTTSKHIYRLLEKADNGDQRELSVWSNGTLRPDIPAEFDARVFWANCPKIGEIKDQGQCASGWALAGVGAIADRICIRSNGIQQISLSAQEIVSCSTTDGCAGDSPETPWVYWGKKGIVSGGDYKSHQGCYPYEVEPCQRAAVNGIRRPCRSRAKTTPICKKKCEKKSNINFEKDRQRGEVAYQVPNDEESIQTEIITYGPVAAFFRVHQDFIHYKSGVYKHSSNHVIGGLTTKILGWGVEDGNPYWLCANSWNTDWGERGYFKILRGHNECGIEGQVIAGLQDP